MQDNVSHRGKKVIRDQGQSSSNFSFLEVHASSLLGKNCKDPSSYPPPSCLIFCLEVVKGQRLSNTKPTELTEQN